MMEWLLEWTIITALSLIDNAESRTGRGGSASRPICDYVQWDPPETVYIHPGNTWVNYMLYSLFGFIVLAMLIYITFIHIMRHFQHPATDNKRGKVKPTQGRTNSSMSEDVLTSREVEIS